MGCSFVLHSRTDQTCNTRLTESEHTVSLVVISPGSTHGERAAAGSRQPDAGDSADAAWRALGRTTGCATARFMRGSRLLSPLRTACERKKEN